LCGKGDDLRNELLFQDFLLLPIWGTPKDPISIGAEERAVIAKIEGQDAFGDVWGNDVVLAYTNISSDPNVEEPSFGYTYAIEGHPLVEQPYWDPNSKSWIYGVSFDNTPVLSGITAGYLIQDAGAAAA